MKTVSLSIDEMLEAKYELNFTYELYCDWVDSLIAPEGYVIVKPTLTEWNAA